jgi:RNA recognition motif-containing protein
LQPFLIPPYSRHESRKIFVGGLAPEVNEKEFNDYFSKFGPIHDSIVMYDKKTNRSRGFGFVTFDTEEGVQAVLSCEHEIMGKWVEIKRAEPRDAYGYVIKVLSSVIHAAANSISANTPSAAATAWAWTPTANTEATAAIVLTAAAALGAGA